MRVLPEPSLGVRDPDHRQELRCPTSRLRWRHPEVDLEPLRELAPDGEHRVERGHRLLEDHRDLAAADPPHLLVGERQEVPALEADPTRHDPTGGRRDEGHDGERADALSAAPPAAEGPRLDPESKRLDSSHSLIFY